MEELLGDGEREDILDALSELVRARGASEFMHRPLLLPKDEHFPDEWRPDLDGANAMLGRLLAWAGLGAQPFAIDHAWDGGAAAACFLGRVDGALSFGLSVQGIEEPDRLVGVLAHEVAHAWRAHHGLGVEDSMDEECLTDLTTHVLGMGLFTTNNTFRYRAWSEGRTATWHSERIGYLSPLAMSFALAVVLRARDSKQETAAVLDALERSQRPLVDRALEVLPPTEALRARLGITATPRPAAPIALPPAARLAPALPQQPTRYALRWSTDRIWMVAPPAFIVASIASAIVKNWWLLALTIPAIVVGRWWRYDICTADDCRTPLRADQDRCGACGALLVGRFEAGRREIEPQHAAFVAEVDARAAEEALEQQALEAEAEAEALDVERPG
jgi:hypothetical protein